MKWTYDFEGSAPPPLSEASLQAELERRRLQRQTALLALASVLTQIAGLLLGVVLLAWQPLLAAVCLLYVLVSATGGGVIVVVLAGRKEALL